MFDSLRTRLFGTHLLVGGLVLGLTAASFFILLARNPAVDRFVYGRLEAIVGVATSPAIQGRPALRDRRALNRALNALGRSLGARALVYGPEMELQFDSQRELQTPPTETIPRDGTSLNPARSSYVDGEGRTWLMAAAGAGDGGVVVIAARRPSVRTLAALVREALPPLVQAGLVALAASLALSVLVAQWVTGPLQELAAAARGVAAGDYEQSLDGGGPREVREVGAAFVEMLARVKASRRAQRDFVANVSHELKTPLTSIQGYAQAILDGTAHREGDRRQAARVIHEESLRLRRLVNDLLDLAQMDAGQLELRRGPVDVEGLLVSVIDRLSGSVEEKQIELDVSFADLPRIVADGDRLRQVFLNLLVNAIQHSPQGGRIAVQAGAEGGEVRVDFVDSGPGIPDEDLPRLFERFYQVDKARPSGPDRGAGLGLAIAQELTEAHDGSIEVESEMGRGTRFTVRLPAGRPDDSTLARQAK